MKITATIRKVLDRGMVKAIADATIDDAFAIHNIKIIDGEKGMFMSMPSDKWTNKDGETKYTDIVHPVNSEARAQLFKAVSDAYEAKLAQLQSEPVQEEV
ncbi:MAG TPA: SpoVG family protein [Bacillota bacterium]|nr:SpoVG family protein [Bacillota bacterium]